MANKKNDKPKTPPKANRGNRVTKKENPTRTKKTPENVKAFLEAIENGSTEVEACAAIDVGVTVPYQWAKADPVFEQDWENATRARCAKVLRPVAEKRAVTGEDKPVWGNIRKNGKPAGTGIVGYEKEYDNRLLIYLMDHDDPTYRRNLKVEATVKIDLADRLKKARERAAS